MFLQFFRTFFRIIGAGKAVNQLAGGRRLQGAPLGLGFLDLAFGEAALAADLITA